MRAFAFIVHPSPGLMVCVLSCFAAHSGCKVWHIFPVWPVSGCSTQTSLINKMQALFAQTFDSMV